MPRSSSSSTSSRSSSGHRSPSSDDEDRPTRNRRRRTTSEESKDRTTRSNDRPTRRSRGLSQSQSDDKATKQKTRARRDRDDDAKSKKDDRRRKRDDSPQQDRGEKRHGDATSSHKAKSSKEVDYSEKPSKSEPKFEPRISMYKYDPFQGVMSETAQYNDHRHRLSRARSLVDNKPPPNFGHVHQNMRKLKERQEREDEIERDNQRLLERLVKAMTTTRVDNWNRVDNRLVKASREKERQRILEMAAENRKIAQRIETRQSTINDDRQAAADRAPAQQQRRPAGRPAGPVDRPQWST